MLGQDASDVRNQPATRTHATDQGLLALVEHPQYPVYGFVEFSIVCHVLDLLVSVVHELKVRLDDIQKNRLVLTV